jgi:hypothetical protein
VNDEKTVKETADALREFLKVDEPEGADRGSSGNSVVVGACDENKAAE